LCILFASSVAAYVAPAVFAAFVVVLAETFAFSVAAAPDTVEYSLLVVEGCSYPLDQFGIH
jgi:hypothetical protein